MKATCIFLGTCLGFGLALGIGFTAPPSIADAAKTHWAFQPVRKPPVPTVRDASWVQTPIDAFILAELEKKGLKPAFRADRRTLLRRASFDLVGLPPTLEEMERARNDASDEWYERLVDRLLSSPHYGERWARHWLDVARYADTKGYVLFQDSDRKSTRLNSSH